MRSVLGVVSNLVGITSISRAGISDVILEFGWGTNMNDAVQTVRENLDRLQLPRDVSRPLILRYDPTQDPIMRVGLYGDLDLFGLRLIAEEEIKQELEALKGVAAARVSGGLEEEIRVEISESQLAVMGLGIKDINRRLQEENVNLAGGSLLPPHPGGVGRERPAESEDSRPTKRPDLEPWPSQRHVLRAGERR